MIMLFMIVVIDDCVGKGKIVLCIGLFVDVDIFFGCDNLFDYVVVVFKEWFVNVVFVDEV